MVRPAIMATFRGAKFYNKIFTPIGKDQVKFSKLAIDWYQDIVDYCGQQPAHRHLVENELGHSISTIDLLERQLKMHAKATAET